MFITNLVREGALMASLCFLLNTMGMIEHSTFHGTWESLWLLILKAELDAPIVRQGKVEG